MHYSATSIATTQIIDLLLTPEWKELYQRIGNYSMYILLTNFYIFYLLPSNQLIQLAGPSLTHLYKKQLPETSPHHYRLSTIFYHISYSKYPGFSSHHILTQLLKLNHDLNSVDKDASPSCFAYKSIRNEVAIILVHFIFHNCYSKWKNLQFSEEINRVRVKYGLLEGEIKPIRVPFPPRLNQCKIVLAKLLYYTDHCSFALYLEKYVPLTSEYCEYKKQRKYHLTF